MKSWIKHAFAGWRALLAPAYITAVLLLLYFVGPN